MNLEAHILLLKAVCVFSVLYVFLLFDLLLFNSPLAVMTICWSDVKLKCSSDCLVNRIYQMLTFPLSITEQSSHILISIYLKIAYCLFCTKLVPSAIKCLCNISSYGKKTQDVKYFLNCAEQTKYWYLCRPTV